MASSVSHKVFASPARAGMDPSRTLSSICKSGFPRTRGDGPMLAIQTMIDEMFPPHARGWTLPPHPQRFGFVVPPHARGWTLLSGYRSSLQCVSPARAGMDR